MIYWTSYTFWFCHHRLGLGRLFDGIILLNDDREALWALLDLVRDFIRFWDDCKEALQAVLEEFELHVLIATPEEEVDLDPVTLPEPGSDLGRLYVHVVGRGADLDLSLLRLGDLGFRLHLLVLLLLLILILAVISDTYYWRIGIRGDLNEVEPEFTGLCEGICGGKNAEILAFRPESAYLARPNAFIHPDLGLVSLCCVLRESHFYDCSTKILLALLHLFLWRGRNVRKKLQQSAF